MEAVPDVTQELLKNFRGLDRIRAERTGTNQTTSDRILLDQTTIPGNGATSHQHQLYVM